MVCRGLKTVLGVTLLAAAGYRQLVGAPLNLSQPAGFTTLARIVPLPPVEESFAGAALHHDRRTATAPLPAVQRTGYQDRPAYAAARIASGGHEEYDLSTHNLASLEQRLAALEKQQSPAHGTSDAGTSVGLSLEQRIAALEQERHAAVPADSAVTSDLQQEWEAFKAEQARIKYPNVIINGAFQADTVYFSQDAANMAAVGDIQDGADLRRTRLSAKGAAWQNVNYMIQMDFSAFGRPTFTDVWMEAVGLPVLGNVRVGQWKQPFGLETVTSYRYQTFMERSLLFQTFEPFRHIGVGFYDHRDDLSATWAASVFRTGQDQFGGDIGDNGGYSTAERVTFLPWYDEPSDGRYYLHLGLAHSFSDPDNDLTRFATIPEMFVGEVAGGGVGTSGVAVPGVQNGTPLFADTGNIATDVLNRVGWEGLYVHGPVSLQSEVMAVHVDQAGGPGLDFWGCYAQAGYFLTGEHRPYDRASGAVDRVKPFEDFFRVGNGGGICTGIGAWEIAGRWSYLDLNDANIQGGTQHDLTAGLNWYMNPYAKLQFNYVHAMLDDPTFGEGEADILGARAQVDF